MIRLFSHYVPRRMMLLAGAEALFLMISAYIGISFHLLNSGEAMSSLAIQGPAQAVTFALVMLLLITGMGLYQPEVWASVRAVVIRLAAAFLVGYVAAHLLSFLVPSWRFGAEVLGTTMVFALAGCAVVRLLFHRWERVGALKPRVLVLGTGSRLMQLAELAQRNKNHEVVGYVALSPGKHFVPQQSVVTLQPGDTLLSVARKHAVNQIVVAVRDRRGGGLPLHELLECRMNGIKVSELPTFFEREYRQVLLESINPSWMLYGDGFSRGLARTAVKRLVDLVVSATLLVAALPLMVLTAVCIRLESRGPVLYRQDRVGQGGRVFTIYKFRSMRDDAESGGTPCWAAANDDRTTRVGRIIRKLRIDELPQIINVLRGEMSFVGPRPERPFFVDKLVRQIPYYSLRHCVKPGITGWSQVRFPYAASLDDTVEKLQYDLYYVKNHGLFLDLMILIDTVEVVLWGKGAR